MNNIVKSGFIIFSLFISSITYAAGISEKDVKSVMSKVDSAIANLDVKKVASTLSDNVTITMNISMQGKTQVMKPTKSQYISMLQQGWSMYSNYKYNRSNVKINIKGSKAYVSADVSESMTVQGKTISGNSKEEIIVEVVNGKTLITSVTGYTTM